MRPLWVITGLKMEKKIEKNQEKICNWGYNLKYCTVPVLELKTCFFKFYFFLLNTQNSVLSKWEKTFLIFLKYQ